MKTGRLRHQVTIQRDANHGVPDASGGQQAEDWQSITVRPANVIPLTGRERFTAQQVVPDVTHRVEMRFDPEVQTKPVYRLLYANRPLQIESAINVDERSRELHLMCKEVVV